MADMGSILELMVNSGIGIDYLKKIELELRNFELELKFPTKQIKSTNQFTI